MAIRGGNKVYPSESRDETARKVNDGAVNSFIRERCQSQNESSAYREPALERC
jgi:hypothetical protein